LQEKRLPFGAANLALMNSKLVNQKEQSRDDMSEARCGNYGSFDGRMREELLDREIFDTLLEAKVLIERRRVQNNTVRPHSSLGY
jgi:hypothetical protein